MVVIRLLWQGGATCGAAGVGRAVHAISEPASAACTPPAHKVRGMQRSEQQQQYISHAAAQWQHQKQQQHEQHQQQRSRSNANSSSSSSRSASAPRAAAPPGFGSAARPGAAGAPPAPSPRQSFLYTAPSAGCTCLRDNKDGGAGVRVSWEHRRGIGESSGQQSGGRSS